MRLHNQKENDQAAEKHELKMLCGDGLKSQTVDHHVCEHDRHQHDECSTDKRAQHAPQSTDYDHEQHLERLIDIKCLGRFHAAQP